jgi:HEAT repeat protein
MSIFTNIFNKIFKFKIDAKGMKANTDNQNEDAQSVTSALEEKGDTKAIEALIAALKDNDSNARRRAADDLGELKDKRAVEPLIAALKDSDSSVRKSAAKALGKIKDSRAVDPLIQALKDEEISSKAAFALGEIRDKKAVKPLIQALKDNSGYDNRDIFLFEKAALALGKIGDAKAVEPLIVAQKNDDTQVRSWAALALGELTGLLDPTDKKSKRLKDMDDKYMLLVLSQLGEAYAQYDRNAIKRLEPVALRIVYELNRRGGKKEEERLLSLLNGRQGSEKLRVLMQWV